MVSKDLLLMIELEMKMSALRYRISGFIIEIEATVFCI